MTQYKTIKSYGFPLILLLSIFLGALTGTYFNKSSIIYLKPFGELFLHLIFTAIVPLIFFSVSSAIGRGGSAKLSKIFFYMTMVFLFTGVVAGSYALIMVKLFPLKSNISLPASFSSSLPKVNFSSQVVDIFSVSDFSKLLSHEHILALIVFSILVGLAASSTQNNGQLFLAFLQAGERIFMKVFSLIMYYAPIGFFAYFAVLVSELGPRLMENYIRIAVIYYAVTLFYFIFAYTSFAYLAGKMNGIKLFWSNIFLPAITALATCSSAASIPANLQATKEMHVSSEISEMVVPLGTIIHKDGSIIGGIFKIAFIFGVFHLNFSGFSVLFTALAVSLLVGTIMGAFPSGGMLGELLILTVYGFPASTLMVIAAISIIIDPLATMMNVTGNSVSSMMISRLVEGKKWLLQ